MPSGHELIFLGKFDFDDHTLGTKAGIFEHWQSFCDKPNVLAFNTLSELQENSTPARIFNPGEDQMIYKATIFGTFTNLEADTLAQNNVANEKKLEEVRNHQI